MWLETENKNYANEYELRKINPNFESLTGPDGGFPHYWKCYKCKEYYALNDK